MLILACIVIFLINPLVQAFPINLSVCNRFQSSYGIRSSVNNEEGTASTVTGEANNIPVDDDDDEAGIKFALAKHAFLSVAASIMMVPPEIFTTPPMVEPDPPSTQLERDRRKRISYLLSKGWAPTDGFEIPPEEVDDLNNLMESSGTGKRPSTYGEITELGARQLFHYMGIKPSASTSNCDTKGKEIEFFDLGCGNGKLLLQAFMELPHASRILGIEYANARYKTAIKAWNNMQEDATNIRQEQRISHNDATFNILEGDLFQLDLASATHVYIASLCFTDAMMERLAQKLVQEGTNLRVVATLRPFPKNFDSHFGKSTEKYLEMSWTKSRGQGCTVYFYSK